MEFMIRGFITGDFRGWTPTQFRQWEKYCYGDIAFVGLELECQTKDDFRKKNIPEWLFSWEAIDSDPSFGLTYYLGDDSYDVSDKDIATHYYELRPLFKNIHHPILFRKEIGNFMKFLKKRNIPLTGSWHFNVSFRKRVDMPDSFVRHYATASSINPTRRTSPIRFEWKSFPFSFDERQLAGHLLLQMMKICVPMNRKQVDRVVQAGKLFKKCNRHILDCFHNPIDQDCYSKFRGVYRGSRTFFPPPVRNEIISSYWLNQH